MTDEIQLPDLSSLGEFGVFLTGLTETASITAKTIKKIDAVTGHERWKKQHEAFVELLSEMVAQPIDDMPSQAMLVELVTQVLAMTECLLEINRRTRDLSERVTGALAQTAEVLVEAAADLGFDITGELP